MATKLDLADAQFIGFTTGKKNQYGIIELVQSMGLKKSEWEKWKLNYPTTSLNDNDKNEIDKYFNK